MYPDSEGQEVKEEPTSVAVDQKNTEVESYSSIDELEGKMGFKEVDEGLMHSVLENDSDTIEEGKVIADSINQGMGSFTPEMMMDQLVKDYRNAERIYGERILRYVTGCDSAYVERNIRIPEFQREMEKKVAEGIKKLRKEGFIDKDGFVLERGIEIAALVTYVEELENLKGKGLYGEQVTKKRSHYGERGELRTYRRGDIYKDIAVRDSVKLAIRRGHQNLEKEDLTTTARMQKGKHEVVYALDASGSMRGTKIELAKKAGIALAYHAVNRNDKVGLMIFGSEVTHTIRPTKDFGMLVREMVTTKPGQETNLGAAMEEAIKLFSTGNHTKHLLILTDALPTVGDNPTQMALEAASASRSAGITISIVGISLDEQGKEVAEGIVRIGQGRLYSASADDALDRIVLDDYYRISA